MVGEGIGEASSPFQKILRALSETVSADVTEKEKALLDECEQAIAWGEDKPAGGILRRVLVCAISRGNGSLVDDALRLGAAASSHDDSNSGESLLTVAAYRGKEDIVSSLLGAGMVKDQLHDTSEALEIACCMGRVDVVQVLLAGTDAGLASNGKNSTLSSAFGIAAEAGHVNVMKVLLQRHSVAAPIRNSSFTGETNTALCLAAYGRRNPIELVDFLVEEAGADVNARDGNGSHAALRDSAETIVTLLRHGAELEAEDDIGETPLHLTGCSKRSTFDALADAGANISRRSREGLSVLDMTAIMGSVDILVGLVERKVDVRAVNPIGFGPLHFATWANQKAIESLIAGGADVNARTIREERTPLHIAIAHEGTPKTIATLLRHGADDQALDSTGKSPLQLAIRG